MSYDLFKTRSKININQVCENLKSPLLTEKSRSIIIITPKKDFLPRYEPKTVTVTEIIQQNFRQF